MLLKFNYINNYKQKNCIHTQPSDLNTQFLGVQMSEYTSINYYNKKYSKVTVTMHFPSSPMAIDCLGGLDMTSKSPNGSLVLNHHQKISKAIRGN